MNIPENFQTNHGLARYCTYQIGGSADYFLDAKSVEEVMEAVNWAQAEGVPVFVFGGGSNLLFDDAGFRGLVVRMMAKELRVDGERISADAGAKISDLVQAAAEAGLSGVEAWNGMPGTVGGAVYGNAGCFGVEVKDVLESAEVFLPVEGLLNVGVDFFEYGYRSSRLKRGGLEHGLPGVVLRAVFRLEKGDPDEIRSGMMDIARKRIEKQPAGSSTGSFFKNPVEHPAGWLIEQCGLKGKSVGGAQISEQHANFFVNKGGATAQDILELGALAKAAVKEKFGLDLEEEIVYVPAELDN